VRCCCLVVVFDHLRSVTAFGHQFLLGRQQVREPGVKFPNVVEEIQLVGAVVAEIANEGSDVCPVLLLNVSTVVAVSCPRAGEGDLVGLAVVEQMMIDEF